MSNDKSPVRQTVRKKTKGLLVAAILVATANTAPAATEVVLHSFSGGPGDGDEPDGGLIADSAGNLYGVTQFGGKSAGGSAFFCSYQGCGTIFKLTPDGIESVLYSFTGGNDGSVPLGALIADKAGNFYGTTGFGGTSGAGVVFKLAPGGLETVLYSFGGSPDGSAPGSGLFPDRAGNLYGTTEEGGDGTCSFLGCGTIFKIDSKGTETLLHSFAGTPDGAFPAAGLIADSVGNFYGTTSQGGASGNGTVFKLSSAGKESVLHSFKGGDDGSAPSNSGLIADVAGNLYGTTFNGGGSAGDGVVFKLTPDGIESVLHAFKGDDGSNPNAGVIADSAGNLYGTTIGGGDHGTGTVFKLTPDGKETVLHSFAYSDTIVSTDGVGPSAGLIADSSGNLYGTTENGGLSGAGTVFKLTDTGFVLPFRHFEPLLAIEFGPKPDSDSFQVFASFSLGQGSVGIDPAKEPVTLKIGTFITTIPAGSFVGSGSGPFYFVGKVKGGELEVAIELVGAREYLFTAAAEQASLKGTENPVPVTLAILGGDSGTATVAADVVTAGK